MVLLIIGCTSTLRFQVIDSGSGKPIPGAKVNWSGATVWFSEHLRSWNAMVDYSTDSNGVVIIRDVDLKRDRNSFRFSKNGYDDALVLPLAHINTVDVISYRNGAPITTNVATLRNTITVPLHKNP